MHELGARVTRAAMIPWTTRLGGVGESTVKAALSYFAVVNGYDTDPGLDFYCELVDDDAPSLPFYVQVKGTQHFDAKWGRSIKKSTLLYWLQQPSPVYLVAFDEPAHECYWVSLESMRYELLERMSSSSSASLRLTVPRTHRLTSSGPDLAFVDQVKADTALVHLSRGQAQFRGSGYVKALPHAPRNAAERERIESSIRAGLYSLVKYHLRENDLEAARRQCELLAEFDPHHFNQFRWLGQIYGQLGETERALSNYQLALDVCSRDKTWPRGSLRQIMSGIRSEMQLLQRMRPASNTRIKLTAKSAGVKRG